MIVICHCKSHQTCRNTCKCYDRCIVLVFCYQWKLDVHCITSSSLVPSGGWRCTTGRHLHQCVWPIMKSNKLCMMLNGSYLNVHVTHRWDIQFRIPITSSSVNTSLGSTELLVLLNFDITVFSCMPISACTIHRVPYIGILCEPLPVTFCQPPLSRVSS